ncbi:MAG: hypothetical protein M3003_04980 [Candidatus Dormibacteraeota bacterium]|nr:hypothetical protein [Candidatus Dormibacteraeota bacterium]
MADGEAGEYRRLTEALLQRIFPLNQIEARLGEAPRNWPADVTAAARTSVIGSVTHRRDDHIASMNVYLEGASTADEILGHYDGLLRALGWSPFTPQMPGGVGGFRSAMPMALGRVFCRTESDPFYSLSVAERDGQTRAVITWDAGLDHHPLRQRTGPYGPGGPLAHLIPDLAAPPDVPVQGGGGGGSENEWHTQAGAHTDMPVDALAGHYRVQLVRSGWTLRDEGSDPVVAWSRWKLPEDDYEGMVVVTAPLSDLRELTLTLRSPSRAARSWRTYSGAGWSALHRGP